MTLNYQICTRCIMDTTDPEIQFDENGVCNHCKQAESIVMKNKYETENNPNALEVLVEKIKKDGKGKDYDCIIGVSGGVDSTYVAYLTKELDLRPLAVHLDNGWDSELSVRNVEKTLKKLDIQLQTEVLDWDEFKNLQLAFLRASVPDLEIPSDHAIVAVMFKAAKQNKIKYILAGHNVATESILPRTWSQGHYDWQYILNLNKVFGEYPLRSYPHFTMWELFNYRQSLNWINILDYIQYSKNEAMHILQNDLAWQYYGGKHYESVYTRFVQGYILPNKFDFDKRKAHLSNLIVIGEISRDDALKEVAMPPYSPELQEDDRTYVMKKFSLNEQSFSELMKLPNKFYWDYPSYNSSKFYHLARTLYKKLKN